MKTLIVDDQHDCFDYWFVGRTDVVCVSSGDTALSEVQNQNFDLVLMDGNLYGQQMQGPDVVRAIRSLGIDQPKIFMCTTDVDMQENGLAAGANGTLDKMFLFEGDWDSIVTNTKT